MLPTIEKNRLQLSKNTQASKKSQLGQFLTPARTAAFMASLFPESKGACRLLDAGAGIGSLSAAFLDRWESASLHFQRVELDAFEIDDSLHCYLIQALEKYSSNPNFVSNIRKADFIQTAADWLSEDFFAERSLRYTHAILNPPYRKINANSLHRSDLRRVGIETVNLYTAFVALAVALAAPGGQIVAIIPRSFCNGPYYRPFRDFILERAAIRHIHLFESRSRAFRDDEVLQENLIIRLERDGQQQAVAVSTSKDDTFSDLAVHTYPFNQIISMDNPERFIHIPVSPESAFELPAAICYSLADLGIHVSTGPVVDFRLREYLREMPEADSVPLLYPSHFGSGSITWPITGMKRANSILRNSDTEKWLYPNGFYCVVRRFSSKEERRRIVARVVDPGTFNNAPLLGFENHLNLFHKNRGGLSPELAHGLTLFLNSTTADRYFRSFSGHTQVNATDLRLMKYPSQATLVEMGKWGRRQREIGQDMIDNMLVNLNER